ncbi:MAG: hypothetical protein JW894_14185 [Bacteroidales bacterium]|nr:hypothetical protein [Bacteroidales bacterium]
MRNYYKILFLLVTAVSSVAYSAGTGINVPSIDDLHEFGENIEASIENGNSAYFNQCFHHREFLKRSIDESNNAYAEGFREGFIKHFDIGTVLVDEIYSNGTYSFHKAYYTDGKAKMLFRLMTNEGINYHEFEVQIIDEKMKIVDAYIFLAAEYLSEMVNRLYIANMPVKYCSESDLIKQAEYKELESIKVFFGENKSAKAYREWKKLDPEYKSLKEYQVLGIQLAAHTNEEKFLEHYVEFRNNLNDTKGKYLLPVEGLMAYGYYKESLECIDSLDKCLGKDPMLNLWRANIFYNLNDYEKAAGYYNIIIETYPEYEFTYFTLLGIYIEEKKYDKATSLLEKMTFTFNRYKEDFQEILVEYPDFLHSAEYTEWLKQ